MTTDVVNIQLDAYNSKNIDLFCSAFHENIKIYNFPNEIMIDGKAQLKEVFEKRFQESGADLRCEIVNRMVIDNIIIDHEEVYGIFENKLELIVKFVVEENTIKEAYYLVKKGYPEN